MTTAAVSAVLAQTTNAQFQAWITEVVTALFTTLGVVQTADTGQINPATVTIPGAINTSAGFVIGRFNDTLQATAPIFFKLEFGTGSAVNDPAMWLTVGTNSNGSGTITNGGGGAVTARVMCTIGNQAAASLITSYTSRYVYLNTAQIGYLGVVFKTAAVTAAVPTASFGGFHIYRTNDSNGNATGNGIATLSVAPSATASGNSASNGYIQVISFANAAIIPAGALTSANLWIAAPGSLIYGLATYIESGTGFIIPTYVVDPVVRFSAYTAVSLQSDFTLGTTASISIVGSTPITFISAGQAFGSQSGFGAVSTPFPTFVMPWQ